MTTERTEASALVDALADPSTRPGAMRELVARGPAVRPAIEAGLGDGRYEVRRACVLWLYHFPEPADGPRLEPLLRDSRSVVRHGAVTVLSARHAARPGVAAALVERVLQDESLRVRRAALAMLAWQLAHPDLEGFFTELAESERDPKLRAWARAGARRSREAAANAEAPPC